MELNQIIKYLNDKYEGLVSVNAWGETGLFYNPGNKLKRGAYCITFKEKDGENDFSSEINRESVKFRMNFKIDKESFLEFFDEQNLPIRPQKGKIIKLISGREYI